MRSLLHVIPDLDPASGGTVSALVGLALAQRSAGVHVRLVTTSLPGSDDREIRRLIAGDVPVNVVPVAGRIASIAPLRETLRSLVADAEVVHVHALWEEIQHQACRLARQAGTRYFLSPHGMLDPWSLAQGRLKKRAYLWWRIRRNLNGAAAIHCTTRGEARSIEPLGFTSPKIVIPNGIDLGEFEDPERPGATAEAFFDRFPQVSGKRIVLFLSRLHPKKGLDLLLPAFARCGDADARLVLAGPGETGYVDGLRQAAARLGIADRVLFTGMLRGDERVAALRAADLFVLPSYQENFGIAVAEAMAAGTAVIVSHQVNLSEEIDGRGVGEVIPTEESALASCLGTWLTDPERVQKAGEAGREFAKRYAFPRVAEAWIGQFLEKRQG